MSARLPPVTWHAALARFASSWMQTIDRLQHVPDVGPVVANSIAEFFAEPHNRDVVEKLLAAGVQPEGGRCAERRLTCSQARLSF